MILPLIGLIASVFLCSLVAIVTILLHKKWKLNLINVVVFNFGAFCLFILASYLYGKIFSNNGTLETSYAVIIYFFTAFISLILGGFLSLVFFHKIFKI